VIDPLSSGEKYMKIFTVVAAAAVAFVAMPVTAASAAPHHGWHKVCKWEGHGHHRHKVCRRTHW
jgi:invasion protein IalB